MTSEQATWTRRAWTAGQRPLMGSLLGFALLVLVVELLVARGDLGTRPRRAEPAPLARAA